MTQRPSIRRRISSRFGPEESAPPLGTGTWPLSSLALDVSGACNMACRYCAEAATQPPRKHMSEETLHSAWHMLFPDGIPKTGTSIRLGSGEPLLAFALLKKLDALIKQSGGSASEGRPAVFLTTNGTLVGKEMRDWLVASGWHIKLSLDGPGFIHDRWRIMRSGKGTFSQVSAAVAELAQRIPSRFSVTAVLCRGTDPDVVFQAIADLGVRRIELVPVAHHDESVLPGQQELRLYRKFVKQYAARYVEDEEGKLPSLVRFENCVQRVMGYNRCSVACGAGRNFLGLGPDGALYPCFRFVGIDNYRLGQLPDGVDKLAEKSFQKRAGRPYQQRTLCGRCWAAPFCGGPCFAVAEMFGQGFGEPLELHCEYTRADIRTARWLVERLRARDPERLLAFLPEAVKTYLPSN